MPRTLFLRSLAKKNCLYLFYVFQLGTRTSSTSLSCLTSNLPLAVMSGCPALMIRHGFLTASPGKDVQRARQACTALGWNPHLVT
ncbi:hypothetical protein RRG08_013348 [Elysia crispata]|uniref:Uncharacterized protein n=1 Tax=Elysia crispata TaxID=231223 RepID=A0AAE1AXR1_9GAST|nr:hypothetical protein RRG08_013348 [Elysia crispata]